MSRLELGAEERAAIGRAAETAYPDECCGILVGEASDDGRRVVAVVEAPNVSPRPERGYRIDERLLLEAHKGARAKGLEVVGYFHSHPDGPAVPSALDRERAHPGASYVIAAVDAGRVERLASWRLAGSGEGFLEESIESPR